MERMVITARVAPLSKYRTGDFMSGYFPELGIDYQYFLSERQPTDSKRSMTSPPADPLSHFPIPVPLWIRGPPALIQSIGGQRQSSLCPNRLRRAFWPFHWPIRRVRAAVP